MKSENNTNTRKRIGRPPVDPVLKRVQVSTRMNAAERAMVQQYARKHALTIGEAVRELAMHGYREKSRATSGATV